MISIKTSNKEIEYPKLMITKSNDIVVLMITTNSGVVVWENDSEYCLGYYSNMWTMENFINYDGEITLQN